MDSNYIREWEVILTKIKKTLTNKCKVNEWITEQDNYVS